jgi:spoIIIJ-associated protein
MEWIEVTGKTLADAVDLALDRLGVVEEELEYEVLDEGKTGLFRRSDARIRARVKPLSREKPTDRRRRRGGPEGGRSRGGSRSRSGSPSNKSTAAKNAATKTASAKTDDAEPTPVGTGAASGDAGNGSGSGSSASERTGSGSRRRRRGGSGRSRPAGAREDAAVATEGDSVSASDMPVEDQIAAAVKFTEELVQAFGLTATVRGELDEDDIEVRVDGDDLGVLVGPKGATLHSLEELVRAMLQHTAGGHSARLHLDVGRYRRRRREALAAFATKVANEVLEQGRERSLEPMNAPDRKVVHDALSEVEGVRTFSEGEDPRRRVVIAPA